MMAEVRPHGIAHLCGDSVPSPDGSASLKAIVEP